MPSLEWLGDLLLLKLVFVGIALSCHCLYRHIAGRRTRWSA